MTFADAPADTTKPITEKRLKNKLTEAISSVLVLLLRKRLFGEACQIILEKLRGLLLKKI